MCDYPKFILIKTKVEKIEDKNYNISRSRKKHIILNYLKIEKSNITIIINNSNKNYNSGFNNSELLNNIFNNLSNSIRKREII